MQNIFHHVSWQCFWLVSPGENPGPISLKIEVNKKGNLTVKERIPQTFLLIIREERSSLSFSFTSSSHLFKSCKISCNSSAFCRTFSCSFRASAIFLSFCFKTFQCTIHICKINYVWDQSSKATSCGGQRELVSQSSHFSESCGPRFWHVSFKFQCHRIENSFSNCSHSKSGRNPKVFCRMKTWFYQTSL